MNKTIKMVLAGLALSTMMALAWWLRAQGILAPESVISLVRDHPLGPLAFILLYALFVLTMLPSMPLNLAAGVVWGPFMGGALAGAGSLLGCLAAFLLARTALGQPLARRSGYRAVDWLQNQIESEGWRVVALMRINPIFPTGVLNFGFGLTNLSFFTYAWATAVFLLPPTLAIAYIGAELGDLVFGGSVKISMGTVYGVSAATLLLIFARPLSRRLFSRNS